MYPPPQRAQAQTAALSSHATVRPARADPKSGSSHKVLKIEREKENMVFEKLCSLLARQLGVEVSTLTPETNIVDDLGADSLDVVEFTASIEDEFGIIMVNDAVRTLYTIGEISTFIEKLIKTR